MPSPARSMNSVLVGRREPRLSTPPLRPLTPETSKGFDVIDFADRILGMPLMPWQEEAVIRALELLPDGTYRFRTVVILVGRQNGKTHLFRVLALWRMYIDGTPDGRPPLILSAAQKLDIAKETWTEGVNTVLSNPLLKAEKANVRYANGEQELTLTNGARWRITATTRGAGRGLSVDTLFVDELREQRDEDAWAALAPTTTARPNSLTIAVSNAGDDESVILNDLRAKALAGEGEGLCLLEWSAPDGCDLDDVEAWAMANPAMNIRYPESVIRSYLTTFSAPRFRTEVLCQRVDTLDSAIPMDAWRACADPEGSLASLRSRVVACLDIAPEGEHATLVAAALMDDGRVRLQVIQAWDNTTDMRADLAGLLTRVKPVALGWFPGGPAAAVTTDLRQFGKAIEIKASEVPAVCQGLAEQAVSRRVVHGAEAILDVQVAGASRLNVGDGWRFVRRGAAYCDAVYAAAGAAYLARTQRSVGKPRLVLPSSV